MKKAELAKKLKGSNDLYERLVVHLASARDEIKHLNSMLFETKHVCPECKKKFNVPRETRG